MAAQGLNENRGLVTFTVLGNIVAALLLAVLLGISGAASTNGRLVPSREALLSMHPSCTQAALGMK